MSCAKLLVTTHIEQRSVFTQLNTYVQVVSGAVVGRANAVRVGSAVRVARVASGVGVARVASGVGVARVASSEQRVRT